MKWSIIIPTFNRAWILPKTLERILAQTSTDFELIVVDDGSTDNTEETVESFQCNDSRIRYLWQHNAGQAAARQRGLENARGEWVTYVDSDDELYPLYLEKAESFFAEHPKVTYAISAQDRTLELHDAQHRVLQTLNQPATTLDAESITLKDFAQWRVKPCGTGLFHRRDILNPYLHWDASMRLLEDLEFMMQLGEAFPDNFGYIPTELFHQRQVFGNDGVCAGASYEDWAYYFERLYMKHVDSWLLEGQMWYPSKVEDYREKQRLFEEGKLPPPWKRYFPDGRP